MKTTHSLWQVVEDGEVLEPAAGSCSGAYRNGILFEISSDGDDGTYPRLSDYTRFVNSLDRDGAAYFINRCTRKKNKNLVDFMGVKILRNHQWEDRAVLEFPSPVKVVFGQVGEEKIVREVKRVRGTFTHDYFWTRNGRQSKMANGFEIWFNIEEYLG